MSLYDRQQINPATALRLLAAFKGDHETPRHVLHICADADPVNPLWPGTVYGAWYLGYLERRLVSATPARKRWAYWPSGKLIAEVERIYTLPGYRTVTPLEFKRRMHG